MLDSFPRLTQSSFRAAVREVVKALTEHDTDQEAADHIGCSKQTIRNARDMACDLKAVTLLKIAAAHGPARLQPVMDLIRMKLEWKEAPVDRLSDRQKECAILKAVLALSAALEDDEVTAEEILAHRATLENARDAIDALLSRIKPRGVSA